MSDLTSAEWKRYARHLNLPGFGPTAQRQLKAASVLCVGVGGLGSPLALYLAAAGVGRIYLVDPDRVEETNLQRQVLFGTPQIGELKVEAAASRLRDLNPQVEVIPVPERFTVDNARRLAANCDVLVDGTDNFATRYLSNDAAFFRGIPNVYGSIFRFDGQCSVFDPARGAPCYRCLFPEPPAAGMVPDCAEGGVLGVLPGFIGTMQALETIKCLTGIGTPLLGRLWHFDALRMQTREITLRRDPECPLCGANPSITTLESTGEACGVASPFSDGPVPEMSVAEFVARRQEPSVMLIDVREPWEREVCLIEGAVSLPLGQLATRMEEIPPQCEVVIHCKSGVRSARAARQIIATGRGKVWSLKGGILAWAREVDQTISEY